VSARQIAAALFLAGAALGRAHGQTPDTVKPYTIPPSPAFTFLGTNPGSVDRPITPRALAVSLIEDFKAGGIPAGLAVDVAPWSLVPGLRITPERYRTDRAAYVVANTQLSLGTVEARGDTGSTDLALGVRTNLFDRSDPMTDTAYTNAVRNGLVKCQSTTGPTQQPDSVVLACARGVTNEIRNRWREEHWNAGGLSFAGALGWRFADSDAGRGAWLGWSGWATAAVPLFRGGQALGQLRYDQRGPQGSGLSYGGRAYLGTATTHAFGEVSHLATGDASHRTSWAGGVEFRVLGSFWLSTGVGTVARPGVDEQTVAVIGSLRWDVSMVPRFGRLLQ
jgi:hypothetical protein